MHAMPCYCLLCSCTNCRGHIRHSLHPLLKMLVLTALIYMHANPTDSHAALHKHICLNTTTGAQVATLGKSGVSVGYYDTEENAARAYDRAAIGLLGRDNCSITTNFPLGDYDEEIVPQLIGKTREEVKTTLKNERAKVSAITTFPVLRGLCIETTLNLSLLQGKWSDCV